MTIPYKNSDKNKKEQVATMFNNIAHKYDFLNHTLSMGIDKIWRKKAVKKLQKHSPLIILDIATGTGDFAITAHKYFNNAKIEGIDISEGMINKGIEKITKLGLQNKINLQLGDSENIQFADNTFDAILTGFGVRNFENLDKGLQEIARVLKPGKAAIILEFSKPEGFPIKQLYFFYFKKILPFIGKIFSKDNSAYTYLPDSVEAFPYGEAFKQRALQNGFKTVQYTKLSFGIATMYECVK